MSDRELSPIDELVKTESETNSDGTVNVTIENWEKKGGSVVVNFSTPVGESKCETMNFPQPGGDLTDYKFYRLIKQSGLTMNNADLLEGTEVRAEITASNGWQLVVGDNTTLVGRFVEEVKETMGMVAWRRVIITLFWMVSIGVTVFATLVSINA